MSDIKHKHKGTAVELRAVIWLLDRGYEVFRNVSYYGAIDLVAVKEGETLLLDVKSGGYRLNLSPYPDRLEAIKSLHEDLGSPLDLPSVEHMVGNLKVPKKKNYPYKPRRANGEQIRLGVKFLVETGRDGGFEIVDPIPSREVENRVDYSGVDFLDF